MAPARAARLSLDDRRTDLELIASVRGGESTAYALLWVRHSDAAMGFARGFSSFDTDDLVTESFARVLESIKAGGGPTTGFRPYLLSTIRNLARSWARTNVVYASPDLNLLADPSTESDAVSAALDSGLTASAFENLPIRWQQALWFSEVENLKPREMMSMLGISANGISALLGRAREGLRQSWIQTHLRVPVDPECREAVEQFGAYTRQALSSRKAAQVDAHLLGCDACLLVLAEATQVGARLAPSSLSLAAISTAE